MLLPGLDGTGTLFAPFITALGPEFHVQVVCYPGSVALDYAALQALACAAVPTEGDYVILGESFSGPIALALAALGDTRCRGLVLCCSFVRNPLPALLFLKPLVQRLPFAFFPLRAASIFLLGHFTTAVLRRMVAQALSQVSPQVIRDRLHSVLSIDVTASCEKLGIPILYLRAKHDHIVPRSASQLVVQLCPTAELVEMDAPHFLLQTLPAKAAEVVRSFVRKVTSENDPGTRS
jgi:pimeloyl-ACP methyl ester carboxylesterase